MEQSRPDEPGEGGYDAPELIELGTMANLTLAEGNHFGKLMGGSDAFVMRGHGAITTLSA